MRRMLRPSVALALTSLLEVARARVNGRRPSRLLWVANVVVLVAAVVAAVATGPDEDEA